jgi:hypothetical protein
MVGNNTKGSNMLLYDIFYPDRSMAQSVPLPRLETCPEWYREVCEGARAYCTNGPKISYVCTQGTWVVR